MDLQNIFYALAILFMLAGIFLFAFIGFVVWQGYKKIEEVSENVKDLKNDIGDKVSGLMNTKKSEIASMVGVTAASFVISKFRNIFRKKD